jgi:hypothetical protein
LYGNLIVLFGGFAEQVANDIWVLELPQNENELLDAQVEWKCWDAHVADYEEWGRPEPRTFQSSVVWGDCLWIFAGLGKHNNNDVRLLFFLSLICVDAPLHAQEWRF